VKVAPKAPINASFVAFVCSLKDKSISFIASGSLSL